MKYCPKCGLTLRTANPTADKRVLATDYVCSDDGLIWRELDNGIKSFPVPVGYEYYKSTDPNAKEAKEA